MKRSGLAGVVAGIFLFAAASGHAQVCYQLPTGVDPVNGNFTPTTWVDGGLKWVNNAVGAAFSGVWANTDFDMWFVGSFLVDNRLTIAAHFDGFSLQVFQPPGTSLQAVWGSASNDVWAVGANGLIDHWDGTQWVTVPSGTTENLYAVAGTASDDVWAGGNTVMLHWDGASWTNSPGFVPDTDRFVPTGLAAISQSDAVVATSHSCQRWDGNSWSSTACGVQGGRGIFATSSNDIWVVGYTVSVGGDHTSYRAHWDGSSWSTTVVQDRDWGSIGGTGPTDIWIDGRLHYDGTTWTEMNCGPWFYAMSVSNNGAIMGVNYYGIQYFSGNDGWPFLARTYVPWVGLGGRDPANLFAVGRSGTVIRYDGSRWSGQDFPLPAFTSLYLVFGSSASDIWASGSSYSLFHFDGAGWTNVSFPGRNVLAGFARAPNDAILVDYDGFNARNWHWDGTTWFEITLPIFQGDTITEFWGTAPDDVWAVGGNQSNGSIHHWNGDSWQRAYSAPRAWVNHVGGSARDDAWFTIQAFDAQTTSVLHWDGSSFTQLGTFDGLGGNAIVATGPNDAWLLFGHEIRHYDGVAWNSESHAVFFGNALGVRGAGVFFTTGWGGIYQNR
jgi:hypothetical protein